MSRPLTLVIFDLDGTLVDSLGGIHRCINQALAKHDMAPMGIDHIRGGIGLSLRGAWERLLPDADVAMIDTMVETYRQEFLSNRAAGLEEDPLFPGTVDGLKALETAGHLLSIATNKGRPGVHHALDLHGIGHHFTAIRSAHDGPAKPHPDAVHEILRQTGAEARHTVFIGDTETDMLTAKNAGVAALGVGWGYHAPDVLRASGAHTVFDDYADLPALIDEVLKL